MGNPEQQPKYSVSFGHLDYWLIKTILASTTAKTDVIPCDQLESMIEEVIALDPSRPLSYFHRGYFHSRTNKPIIMDFEGKSEAGMLWYFTGALSGYIKQKKTALVLSNLQSLKDLTIKLRDNKQVGCGAFLLPDIYPLFPDPRLRF